MMSIRVPQKIAILFGGKYAEHDISIFSFINLYQSLQSDTPISEIQLSGIYYIMRDGQVLASDVDLSRNASAYMDYSQTEVVSLPEAFLKIKNRNEFVYLICDGALGVDGRFSGLAGIMGIPGTFGSSLGFGLSRSKFHMNQFVGTHYSDIRIPQTIYVNDPRDLKNAFKVFENRQIVIKPSALGSSIYTQMFVCTRENHADMTLLVNKILDFDPRAMFQEYIAGKEIGCYCIEKDGQIEVLALKEFKKQTLILETKDKYQVHASNDSGYLKNDIPAIQKFAVKLFRDAECRNLARMDFIITEDGDIYFLENNINPALRGMIEAYRAKNLSVSIYDMIKLLVQNEKTRIPVQTDFYLDVNPS